MTDTSNDDAKDYLEIKMNAGWYMTITLATSEKFDKEYVAGST